MPQIKDVNFKQPKYMLPAFLYLPLIGLIWLVIDMCSTKIDRTERGIGETVEYINPNLPNANYKGDGVGGKYENMVKSFGSISDLSAVDGVQRDSVVTEEYESRYTEEDLLFMLEQQRLMQADLLRDSIRAAVEAEMMAEGRIVTPSPHMVPSVSREERMRAEMDSAVAAIRAEIMAQQAAEQQAAAAAETVGPSAVAVSALTEEDEVKEVVLGGRKTSSSFNTVSDPVRKSPLIQAMVDEDLTAVDGSRIRLRLLDDVEIDGHSVPSGTYLYATVSGFGSQRVRGNITSLLVDGSLMKINLSVYDMDGLEGLFVPSSEFRDTGKDIAGSAMNSSMNMNTGVGDNSLAQWAMQGVQNAYRQTSSAISRAIRKNRAKLKYGTMVYLVNSKDNR